METSMSMSKSAKPIPLTPSLGDTPRPGGEVPPPRTESSRGARQVLGGGGPAQVPRATLRPRGLEATLGAQTALPRAPNGAA